MTLYTSILSPTTHQQSLKNYLTQSTNASPTYLTQLKPSITLRHCTRKSKANCPLDGNCLAKNIVYKAIVTTKSLHRKEYIGLTSTTFKERLSNHTQSFKKESLSHSTKLSKYVWYLRNKGEPFTIKWSLNLSREHHHTIRPLNDAICALLKNIT